MPYFTWAGSGWGQRRCHTTGDNRYCIKYLLLIFILLVLSLVPYSLSASQLTNDQVETYAQQEADRIALIAKQEYEAQQEALSLSLTSRALNLIGKKGGQCVIFVRSFGQIRRDQVQGAARNLKINSQEAKIGAVMLTNQSKYGHVQIVIKIKDSVITVVDSNYHWNQRVGIHTIKVNDKRIVGYLSN